MTITKSDLDLADYIFADESGKFQDKNFICLCGYLSSGGKWDSFIGRWQDLLRSLNLSAVHMQTFYSDCAKAGMDQAQATKTLEQFIDIIRDTISVGFAVGLDSNYYRGMPDAAKEGLGDPGIACLQRLLQLIRNRFRNAGYKGRLSITLDEDETYAMKFYNVVTRLRRADRELGSLVGAVAFADDTFILPIQAADILANLTTKWFRDRMTGTATADECPPLLQRLLMSPEKGYGLEYRTELWDGDALRKHLPHFVKWSGFLL
jgi:hypothetical protein